MHCNEPLPKANMTIDEAIRKAVAADNYRKHIAPYETRLIIRK